MCAVLILSGILDLLVNTVLNKTSILKMSRSPGVCFLVGVAGPSVFQLCLGLHDLEPASSPCRRWTACWWAADGTRAVGRKEVFFF